GLQRNQVRPQRITAEVIARAVDRIDDPAAPALGLGASTLFAKQAVVRERLRQQACNQALALAVSLGHRRIVVLFLSDDARLIAKCYMRRLLRGLSRDFQFL